MTLKEACLTSKEIEQRLWHSLMMWRLGENDHGLPRPACDKLAHDLMPEVVQMIAVCGGQIKDGVS